MTGGRRTHYHYPPSAERSTMKKDTATAIFDRFDQAGMTTVMRCQPSGDAPDGRRYEIEVEIVSVKSPEVLDLISRIVKQHQVSLVPGMTSIRIVGTRASERLGEVT
jgi:hypothetical protein